jgi:hypothetical protein
MSIRCLLVNQLWVTLPLTPVEVSFDWLEGEVKRRRVSP